MATMPIVKISPVYSSRFVHWVHVGLAILIAMYLTMMLIWCPPREELTYIGVSENGIYLIYFMPLTSLMGAAALVLTRHLAFSMSCDTVSGDVPKPLMDPAWCDRVMNHFEWEVYVSN
eukprot:TRINITY_DN25901_c0_g1_i1.p1 TRINITY_DN25901_c0_g1~~TRINITY_DN25901_c0_g1_i1.p1  ORF type:complete len:118 (-),score=6.43 TRINITY_DN25901_c0_g1_i1:101-454(-)